MTQSGVVDSLIDDLVAVLKEEKEKAVGMGKSGEPGEKGDTGQLYGVAGGLPDKGIVNRMGGGDFGKL